MYTSLLKDKFPEDEKNGLYKAPRLPAVKLGKILIRDKRIASPNDVVALHLFSGLFSGGVIIFTKDSCFYDEGAFLLEDIKEVQVKGSKIIVFANQQTQNIQHNLAVKNEQVAKTISRILEAASRYDPEKNKVAPKADYAQYSTTELDWLNLRDEVMRTIDMLFERYNDGKLSMLEYEEKKDDLLRRL